MSSFSSSSSTHLPSFNTLPFSSHVSSRASLAFLESIARSIAPDVTAPNAVPKPEPIIADDAALCARVKRYAFSLNVVTSIPNQSGVQSNIEPAYSFFDAVGLEWSSPEKKFAVNTQSSERSSNNAPNVLQELRIWSRNEYNFCSSALTCFSASWRTIPNTVPTRAVKPESASVHSVAMLLHFAMALSPALLPRHLSNFCPHSVIMQSLYLFPQSSTWLYCAKRIACFLSSLISFTNTENSWAVQPVFFLHEFNLSENVVSESVSHFL